MKKILVICLLVLLVTPTVTFAVGTPASLCRINATTGTGSNASSSPQLGECVSQIYLWALGAAGILALLMMVIGGYYVITASGNAAQATKGKSFLFSSLIGLLILLGAYLLLSTINPDLTCFKVDVSRPTGNPPSASTPNACP